jgi:predicted enzyme related to lactoylglutathione lyase
VSRVVHFELLSDDPEQSLKFFSEAFGWENQSWPGQTYWLVNTGDDKDLGINGGIMRSSDFPHTQNAVITIDVPDIGEALQKVEAAGGKVISPERKIGEAGWAAYAADPQGVVVGIWKSA